MKKKNSCNQETKTVNMKKIILTHHKRHQFLLQPEKQTKPIVKIINKNKTHQQSTKFESFQCSWKTNEKRLNL